MNHSPNKSRWSDAPAVTLQKKMPFSPHMVQRQLVNMESGLEGPPNNADDHPSRRAGRPACDHPNKARGKIGEARLAQRECELDQLHNPGTQHQHQQRARRRARQRNQHGKQAERTHMKRLVAPRAELRHGRQGADQREPCHEDQKRQHERPQRPPGPASGFAAQAHGLAGSAVRRARGNSASASDLGRAFSPGPSPNKATRSVGLLTRTGKDCRAIA